MPKPLALEMSTNHLRPDANGEIAAPDAPGLGIEISPAGVRKYLQAVEIRSPNDFRLFHVVNIVGARAIKVRRTPSIPARPSNRAAGRACT